MIRRHRIPRPAPCDDTFYTVEDFNIGNEIVMYSKTFKITDCDQFTKNFLHKLGVRVNVPNNRPDDPYMDHRKAVRFGLMKCSFRKLIKYLILK